MQLDIYTPEKKVFSGEADSVSLPGTEGRFQILNHHAPLIAALKGGELRLENKNVKTSYQITTGFVEVLRNKVTVLVEGIQ
jgi:F-type H+-transporting ATPase subunit epsilon